MERHRSRWQEKANDRPTIPIWRTYQTFLNLEQSQSNRLTVMLMIFLAVPTISKQFRIHEQGTISLEGLITKDQRPLYPHQGGRYRARNHAGVFWQRVTYVTFQHDLRFKSSQHCQFCNRYKQICNSEVDQKKKNKLVLCGIFDFVNVFACLRVDDHEGNGRR